MNSFLPFTSLLLSLGALCVYVQSSLADPGWISLSLTRSTDSKVGGSSPYSYANDISFGTPPAKESPLIDIASSALGVSSSNCAFCPGTDHFDPSLSSTYKSMNASWLHDNPRTGGSLAEDTVSLGGILTSKAAPLNIIDWMSSNATTRFANGILGLWVNSVNDTAREQHIFTRLQSSGELLNPVVGLRMGRTPETSHITIGALDPNDFDGTINWVQAETPDPSWDNPVAIKVDGFRGFNGSFLPYGNPLVTYLTTLNDSVNLPDVDRYTSEPDYTGPVKVTLHPVDGAYAYNCTNTSGAYVHLSVDINGVNYQIDSQDNLLKNETAAAEAFYGCEIALYNPTTTAGVNVSLGIPFFRSVYLAYRFPTPDCPLAYYGFAYQKGANRTSSMIAQQPSSTPSASAQCLTFATPTSTPVVSNPPAPHRSTDAAYSVWGHPDVDQVKLIGVEDLKADVVIV